MQNSLYSNIRDEHYYYNNNNYHCCGLLSPTIAVISLLVVLVILLCSTIVSLTTYDYTLALSLKHYQLYLIIFTVFTIFIIAISMIRERYFSRQPISIPVWLIVLANGFITILGIYSLYSSKYKLHRVPYIIVSFDVTFFGLLTSYLFWAQYLSTSNTCPLLSNAQLGRSGESSSASSAFKATVRGIQNTLHHQQHRKYHNLDTDIDTDTDLELDIDMFLPTIQTGSKGSSIIQQKKHTSSTTTLATQQQKQPITTINPSQHRQQVTNDSLDDLDITEEFTDLE